MSLGSFFGKVVAAISVFLTGAIKAAPGIVTDIDKALEVAAQVSLNLVNGLKKFIDSPEGQAVEDVVKMVVPAQWVDGALAFLPTIIADLGWAKQEFSKSPADVVKDGITFAVSSTNKDVVASNLATLAAHVNTYIGKIQGITIPIQASLSQAHVVYLGLPQAPAQSGTTENTSQAEPDTQEQADPNV